MATSARKSELLDSLLRTTNFARHTVARYGYGETRIPGEMTAGPFLYEPGDKFDLLQARLAEVVGVPTDNPECYVVTNQSGQQLCLWFYDWKVAVGTSPQPR